METRASKSSVVKSVKGFFRKMPALFTRTSTVPKLLIAASTASAAVSWLPISPSSRTRLSELVSFRLASREVATSYNLLPETLRLNPRQTPRCSSYDCCFLARHKQPFGLKVRIQYTDGHRPSQKRLHPARRAAEPWREEPTNPWTSAAISSAAVSKAKWPPSTMWTSALGTSRR